MGGFGGCCIESEREVSFVSQRVGVLIEEGGASIPKRCCIGLEVYLLVSLRRYLPMTMGSFPLHFFAKESLVVELVYYRQP